MLPITGYSDRLSVQPGESIDFKVSCHSPGRCEAHLVKVRCGDANPAGPGIREHDLSDRFHTAFDGRHQAVHLGSYVHVDTHDKLSDLGSMTLVATVWPTTPDKTEQAVLSWQESKTGTGFALLLDAGNGATARIRGADGRTYSVHVGKSLRARRWYRLWMSVNLETGELHVGQLPLESALGVDDAGERMTGIETYEPLPHNSPLLIGALGTEPVRGHFNGKIERPYIVSRAMSSTEINARLDAARNLPIAACWDFSVHISSSQVVDVGPRRLHGQVVNMPARAMTGSAWDGSEMCWTHAPTHYAAIHFHDDDLHDCGWQTDFSFTVPADLASGAYAMRIRAGDDEDMIPFFVRAARGKPGSRICVLMPTYTYVIYANHARGNTNKQTRQRLTEWGARPWTPDDHQDYGLSTYNFHSDRSGICHSSRLRPMLTLRSGFVSIPELPGSGVRHFPADTHLLDWLEEKEHDYDVVTDEDLHAEGVELLASYPVIMTTTHPEYHTENTLDALQSYINNGGKLMYMGGNGFYWRIAVHRESEGVLEIRRGEGGIRAWAAEPGEYYNAFDGAYGGLWRRNGRPPQKLAGIGFTGQGLFESSHYKRKPGADDERTAWIFDGVDDEILGDFGLCGGGAAGYELDRADVRLGSPENLVILASSENPPDSFVLVPEEHLTHVTTWSGEPVEELIRADMVYFDTPSGGAVFSTGSITFCGSLFHNNYDNNISRIIDNVVSRFKAHD